MLAALDVTKEFSVRPPLGRRRAIVAVRGVTATVARGRILGIAGESGSGKSTLARMLAAMERPTSGEVRFKGEDAYALRGASLAARQRQVQFVFQNPFDALNPRFSVEQCVEEPLVIQGMCKRGEATDLVAASLEAAGLVPPEPFLHQRASKLSGGQLQRVAIARGLVTEPEVLIADEPVSMLDVSVRAGILAVLDDLRRRQGLGIAYISHDLGTIRLVCDDVIIMRGGEVVESGPAGRVLDSPQEDYTRRLVAAAPTLDATFLSKRAAGPPTLL